jgi:drug/metabolite transporter (DMT)-like permease
MYALPPIFTFLISVGLGLTSFKVHKLVGLCVAVLACSWIVIQRHESTGQTNTVWFLLGLLIPVMLSIGNVYRSVAWPEGSKPGPLAAGTLLSASGLLGIYAMLNKVPFIAADLSWHAHSLILVQGCLTAATFLCSFELQTRSNPVFYSQLGSVAAVFGLVIGVLWFDERYSYLLWIGVLVLLTSLRVSNLPSLKWRHMLFHFKKSANKQVLLQDSKASDTA